MEAFFYNYTNTLFSNPVDNVYSSLKQFQLLVNKFTGLTYKVKNIRTNYRLLLTSAHGHLNHHSVKRHQCINYYCFIYRQIMSYLMTFYLGIRIVRHLLHTSFAR